MKIKKMVEVEVEVCDVCKKNEIRDYNEWCVACNKALCEDCVADECDDGAICKECEKKGFELMEIAEEGDNIYTLFYKGKIWKGEDFW